MSFEAVLGNKEFELAVRKMNKNNHGYMTVWYTKGI
jgi:hypothetical protein